MFYETIKATELEKFLNETLVKHVENLNKLKKAYSQNESYFVGDKLSWADLYVFQSIEVLLKAVPDVKDKFGDKFKSLIDAIHANANLKAYLDSRPATEF
ncbi:unnamed protein product [Rotaria sp. Silwood2]|nr:unnamed protein product [Rotaria sp. Silwood2]